MIDAGEQPQASRQPALAGRYTSVGDLLVEGTSPGLHTLVVALRRAPSSLDLETPGEVDPSPYEGFLRKITVSPTEGGVRISRDGTTLVVSGAAESCAALADAVEVLATEKPGNHLHVDYFDGHFYLDSSTTPLVLKVRGE